MSYYTRQSLILVLSNAVWWAITPITQSCFTIKASVQKLSFVRVTVTVCVVAWCLSKLCPINPVYHGWNPIKV